MIVFGKLENSPITLSIKQNCLTLSIEKQAQTNVFSFDYEGRPWTAMIDNISYRRGLDGKTVAKWLNPDNTRSRRWIPSDESDHIAELARSFAESILVSVQNGNFNCNASIPAKGFEGLLSAAEFTKDRRAQDVGRYQELYLPVGILPPDQYGAVVLQATEGCSFNACTFCDFYKNRPFRIKTPDQFNKHCEQVKDYLAKGLSLRRTIFLGDANALVISNNKLLPLLEIVHMHFDVQQLGGIYAFLDGVSGEKKSHADYLAASDYGLERVYIGLESGNDELLSYLNKPSRANEVIGTVNALKKAGIAVGIIILLGAGGKKYEAVHIRDSISALNKMKLDLDDVVYFSELVENEGLAYTQKAFQGDLLPLTEPERTRQGQKIQEGMKFSRRGGTPHISRYDIREFVY